MPAAVYRRFLIAAQKRKARDPKRTATTLVAIRSYALLSYDDLETVSDGELADYLHDLRHTNADIDHLDRVRLRQAHKGVNQPNGR